MRADRLLTILLTLQTEQRVTAQELARRLEVSVRTIYRDMDALSGAGVPVVADRGVGGGWSLLEPYETDLTGLNTSELWTVMLPRTKSILSDLGLEQAYQAAVVKLLAALPVGQRRDAEFMRQRIHVDDAGWQWTGETISGFAALQQAVWQERKVQIVYKRSDGETVERLIDPLGLVAKGSVWYVVAGVEGKYRTYRISRVQRVEITEMPCQRPDDFDLVAYWEASTAEFVAALPKYWATLRVAGELVKKLRFAWRYAKIEEQSVPDENGWVEVVMRFHTEGEACRNILQFGEQIIVLDPLSLRDRVVEQSRQVIALYATHDLLKQILRPETSEGESLDGKSKTNRDHQSVGAVTQPGRPTG